MWNPFDPRVLAISRERCRGGSMMGTREERWDVLAFNETGQRVIRVLEKFGHADASMLSVRAKVSRRYCLKIMREAEAARLVTKVVRRNDANRPTAYWQVVA